MKPISTNTTFGMIALLLVGALVVLLAISVAGGRTPSGDPGTLIGPDDDPLSAAGSDIPRFKSGAALLEAFKNASEAGYGGPGLVDLAWPSLGFDRVVSSPQAVKSASEASGSVSQLSSGATFSTTNVQVAGVDEADIVKTDGDYIYLVSGNVLYIVKAYPAGSAKVVSTTTYSSYTPKEIFVDGDRLVVFGTSSSSYVPVNTPMGERVGGVIVVPPERHSVGMTSVKLYDISDREDPELLRSFEMEGNYETARLIGHDAYFVVNTAPAVYYTPTIDPYDIVPMYRENSGEFAPVAGPTDIGYMPPARLSSFTTVASMSTTDEDKKIAKETIAGSGQNVYASPKSLYVAQGQDYGYYRAADASDGERTSIAKFDLEAGKVRYAGTGKVPGHLLNQFSMDEHDGYFRVATTIGEVWNTARPATNNVYVLDSEMDMIGSLEDLAPGEKIYSTRFMGSRCYMVTFKKVDPLFVIDLSSPRHPKVLGKLKIPGYSDYLHPIDETHLIGLGKDATDASDGEVSSRSLDFAWYQGIKMAIFDVSDVEHPVEMFKTGIGDRGTDSPALTDHRAFLFDREKGLLVLPVTVAEIQGKRTSANQYGEFVFQGAYVYDVSLDEGFQLRGKVTQYDSDDAFKKSGSYFYGDKSITRSLYIRNVLYTLSSSRLQLNDLSTLEKLKAIEL